METWKLVEGQEIERPALPSKRTGLFIKSEGPTHRASMLSPSTSESRSSKGKLLKSAEEDNDDDKVKKIKALLSEPLNSNSNSIQTTTNNPFKVDRGKRREDATTASTVVKPPSPRQPPTSNTHNLKRKLFDDDSDDDGDTISFMYMKK